MHERQDYTVITRLEQHFTNWAKGEPYLEPAS